MTKPGRYAADVSHVREVTLRGTADLGFWSDRLREEDLVPADEAGRAQLLIIAADLRFLGIRFREISFSVLVSRPGAEASASASFLVQAWSSFRPFAWCERVLFSTPYAAGGVSISAAHPCSIELTLGKVLAFRAEMGLNRTGGSREPASVGAAGWAGPVFLPRQRGGASGDKVFLARIKGLTRTYPFVPDLDALAIAAPAPAGALQALLDSHFKPRAWEVREDAEHAKSKTYLRSQAPWTGSR